MSIALLGLAVLLAISFAGLPLGFSMLVVGTIGFGFLRSFDAALNTQAELQQAADELRKGTFIRP